MTTKLSSVFTLFGVIVAAMLLTALGELWTQKTVLKGAPTFPFVTPSVVPSLRSDGVVLEFQNGQNAFALLEGWSKPEAWGVWSEGKQSYIAFRVAQTEPDSNSFKLILKVLAYVVPGVHPQQRVIVSSSTGILESLVLKDPNTSIIVPLQKTKDFPEGVAVLKLSYPDAITPREVQNTKDDRLIAVGVISAQLSQ